MSDLDVNTNTKILDVAAESSKPLPVSEQKLYIESLNLKNTAPPPDEDKILAVARGNERIQHERIGIMINEVAKFYGDV